MMCVTRALLVYLCLGVIPTVAGEWQPELGIAVRVLFDDSSDDTLTELTLKPAAEWAGENCLLRISARLRAQSAGVLDRSPPVTRHYDSASRPQAIGSHGVGEVRQLYLSCRVKRWQTTIGRQLQDWGKLDGFKILDAVNPQDFREYILDDFSESRIGTWGVGVRRDGPRWGWQFLWSPDRGTHDLADPGTAFELTAPRFTFDVGSTLPNEVRRLSPTRGLVAAMLERRSAQWDWRLMVLDGFDYEPVIGMRSGNTVLFYPRRRLVGGNIERTLGSLVLRAEAAYRIDREINPRRSTADQIDRIDQATIGVGLDYAAPWNIAVNAQLVHDTIRNAPADLVRPDRETLSTVNLRRSFRNETYDINAKWYHSHTDRDGLIQFAVSYRPGNAGTISLGIDSFYGASGGLFGQFSNHDRIYLTWEHAL